MNIWDKKFFDVLNEVPVILSWLSIDQILCKKPSPISVHGNIDIQQFVKDVVASDLCGYPEDIIDNRVEQKKKTTLHTKLKNHAPRIKKTNLPSHGLQNIKFSKNRRKKSFVILGICKHP